MGNLNGNNGIDITFFITKIIFFINVYYYSYGADHDASTSSTDAEDRHLGLFSTAGVQPLHESEHSDGAVASERKRPNQMVRRVARDAVGPAVREMRAPPL